MLWKIRSAVVTGNVHNLPRLIGVSADEATYFADRLLNRLGNRSIFVYYLFVVQKNGDLDVYLDQTIIEAIREDLWNLFDRSKRAVTIGIDGERLEQHDKEPFIFPDELTLLIRHTP